MGWIQDVVCKLFKIIPAKDRRIVIKEPLSFRGNVLKNKIWYRGEPAELEQFFKAAAKTDADHARFWASVPFRKMRKIHSGIVSTVVDTYRDIVTADVDGVEAGTEEAKKRWELIAENNSFEKVLGSAVSGALASGDGAFKVSMDEISELPIIEFYDSETVDFKYRRGRLTEILFYTKYRKGEKEFQLEETYGKGYVKYRLFDEAGSEIPMDTLEETKDYEDTAYDGKFIMAVPLVIFESSKWAGRGKALFDVKTDVLDALDEVISQWLDAVRKGRINRYIPEDMLPRNPETGEPIPPNDFDNDYIAIGSMRTEGATEKIEVSQPNIAYETYVNSYSNFLDMVLQGIISPSTLGIDLKKTDNAESQREKEKITLHVRGKIVTALDKAIPEIVKTALQAHDLMQGKAAGEYEASVKFGEYASPDFDSTVEAVGKAKSYGIMSTEKAVDEMYGDTMTKEEKEEEVRRIKEEQGIMETEEPSVGMDKEVYQNESAGDGQDIPDGRKRIQGFAPGGQ